MQFKSLTVFTVITVTFMMETVMLLLLLTMLTLRGDEDELMDCKIISRLSMYVV